MQPLEKMNTTLFDNRYPSNQARKFVTDSDRRKKNPKSSHSANRKEATHLARFVTWSWVTEVSISEVSTPMSKYIHVYIFISGFFVNEFPNSVFYTHSCRCKLGWRNKICTIKFISLLISTSDYRPFTIARIRRTTDLSDPNPIVWQYKFDLPLVNLVGFTGCFSYCTHVW